MDIINDQKNTSGSRGRRTRAGKRVKRKARAVDQYITMGSGDPVEVVYRQNETGGMTDIFRRLVSLI